MGSWPCAISSNRRMSSSSVCACTPGAPPALRKMAPRTGPGHRRCLRKMVPRAAQTAHGAHKGARGGGRAAAGARGVARGGARLDEHRLVFDLHREV